MPPAHPTVVTVDPVPLWHVNGAASVLAKQLSPVAQHPNTVVCVAVDAYDAIHLSKFGFLIKFYQFPELDSKNGPLKKKI